MSKHMRPRLNEAEIQTLLDALKTHILDLWGRIREARKQIRPISPYWKGYDENTKALLRSMTQARLLRIYLKRLASGKGKGRRPDYLIYGDHTIPSCHYEDDLKLSGW